jgi:subtilisin family serine protease
MKAALTTALAVAILAALSPGDAEAQGRSDRALAALNDPGKSHVPGEMLVQFRRDVTDTEKDTALQAIGARFADQVRAAQRRADGGGDLELVRLPTGLQVAAAIGTLRNHRAIDFIEPNWVYRKQATSNDTYYTNGSLWGMYGDASSPANPYGSQASERWAARGASCSGVYVGVIDEGYMYTHTDLAANAGTNPGEIPGNGVDDDGNGYVDDVYGWDFAGNNNTVFDGVGDDHGTHVAGTIGGVGGNGAGVAGVCWTVKIIGAKFLGSNGGTTANAIKAIDYITDLKLRHGLNIVATNNSWGGGGFSQGLQDAIGRANAAGILFIAAAGNNASNNDTTANYPSNYPNANVIAVASITSTGGLSSFSNYGASTVDLGAPGSAIWSTVPVRTRVGVGSGYASYSGTSMATPHVTGAAALYAAVNPGASAAQIKSAILGSVEPTSSLNGRTVTGGRLNVSGF